MKMTAVNNSSK